VKRIAFALFFLALLAGIASAQEAKLGVPLKPQVFRVIKFAQTSPLRDMKFIPPRPPEFFGLDLREEGPIPIDDGYHGAAKGLQTKLLPPAIPSPLITWEGPGNSDNNFQVSPPDPVGDVGKHHYVAMVNLAFSIYNKRTGALLFGPADIGTLWQGFLSDCTDASGDPIVFYDHLANRWILTQFTTRGPNYYNCMAVSQTQDPLGSYNLYAFTTGRNFPDYPKYGFWPNSYTITTREFDPSNNESVGVYAVNRYQILQGNPSPQVVSFHVTSPAYVVGNGMLASDFDGATQPPVGGAQYVVGTMDDQGGLGAPFDGLNIFDLRVSWAHPEQSTLTLGQQLPIDNFDTLFPCSPSGSRACIPQPGTSVRIDHLGYRQRPTWRLQYRNFGNFETMVTNQSVEGLPGISGMRWWEIRNPRNPVIYQDGTYAPDDGVHRWMGSIAMDKQGNMMEGFSVSNGTDVFPGIRYAGRLVTDPLNELSQGEAVLLDGSGSQLDNGNRWGDYTAMNIDPTDDCTFYYINEYYSSTSLVSWHTRIGAMKFPGCK
jgi:hypothetical protein